MTNPTKKEERTSVSTVMFLNQGEGLYTKEARTVITITTTSDKGEINSTKRLIRRIILARYRVVKRSEKYHVVHVNSYTKKKVYLRRVSLCHIMDMFQ